MKRRVQEYACGSDQAEKFVARDAAFELNAISNGPSLRGTGNRLSFRSVSEDSKHGVRMTDEPESANRQPASFPRQQACRENDVLAARLAHRHVLDLHRRCIGQQTDTFSAGHHSSCIPILGEDDDSSLPGQPRRSDSCKNGTGDRARQLLNKASTRAHPPTRVASPLRRRRVPNERLVNHCYARSGPVGSQRDVVNNVEMDLPSQLRCADGGLALPAVVIPMKARSSQSRIQFVINIGS